ncbi:MAG TPA: hypothetical protein VM939_05125 [Gemmatimonadaceae bacterium]|nr:hypothetical protein [Gemmatimonadaceae bacterium]
MTRLALNIALAMLGSISVLPGRVESQEVRKGFAAITVSDLASSEKWYQANLGTRRLSASRSPSGHAENVVVGNDYFIFELIHFAAKAPTDTVIAADRDIGLKKVGIWVDEKTFDLSFEHLTKSKARFIGGTFTDTVLKARSFLVQDNSGVIIQFFKAAK